MGMVRTLRLPDDLDEDVSKYLVEHKIKFTDLVIAGIRGQIHERFLGDTVYEAGAVKPAKVKKRPVDVAPIVNAMLSGVKVSPTVQHHPTCKCGVCKE